ncbi:SH3 domain-containing protein [Bartonella sp. HY329]|uniref:SH3 domain-containing protein n=1 Tax=unclassified Bartonella TaxID=2645622 RepID=UPI0021C993F5|nr:MULTISPECIES: SH3 domain-containing protein [unclassified Bartonella]UXM94992.1 SH3 domain-containing protein [Bartonella sp. HY329]UXN09315.1 SH3 domain-containing protein [Bartonella sp. HY328]
MKCFVKYGIATFFFVIMFMGNPQFAPALNLSSPSISIFSGPSTAYPIISKIPKGTNFDIKACNAKWCHITTKTIKGWVEKKKISKEVAVNNYHKKTVDGYVQKIGKNKQSIIRNSTAVSSLQISITIIPVSK